MNLEILLSCMHESDLSIVTRSNIESDVLIINQSDLENDQVYTYENSKGEQFKVRLINTIERGLSKSRNMALNSSTGDICLISDDDQIFVSSYESIILKAFKDNPIADIIAFAVTTPRKKSFKTKSSRVGYIGALRIGSSQIAFRRKKVIDCEVNFDEKMGSGSGNGGGEETKFLYDCLKQGLKIYYLPVVIASLAQNKSQWANGFSKKYFIDKGWAHKRIKGYLFGLLTILRFVIVKYPLYKHEMNFLNALFYSVKGIFCKR